MNGPKPIDLRSDTVTRPTPRMRQAMYEAEVGDDVMQEDPTVNALQQEAAERLGKEAALLVPSGTFANQLALFTHCRRGAEVVLSDEGHIVQHEAGAAAIIAGVQLRTIHPADGFPRWKEIEPAIRKEENIHYPPTGLVALENALSNGEVMPLEVQEEIFRGAHSYQAPIHVDGARIFNAALALKVDAAKLAGCTDSLMFCLSKGLCAPVGSLVTGSREFIAEARKKRKIMGGGMRQAGVLAAAGLVALREMVDRLAEDHQKAGLLAESFQRTGLFEVRPLPVKINMFFVRFRTPAHKGKEARFAETLAGGGVLTYPPEEGWLRFVTHHDVSFEDVESACRQVERAAERLVHEP
jgi:threonine aldolase